MQLITNYIDNLNKRYKTGISREHAYRGDLQLLLEQLLPDVLVTNEPARIECGSPDYILTQKDIPIGYIEAKDIGKPLDSKDYKEQFERYRKSLNNLVITDYIKFRFYRDGELVTEIQIADIDHTNHIKPISENFQHFINLISDFSSQISQSIRSPTKLSKMMASKARLLANIIENALNSDIDNDDDSTLKDQMKAFKSILIHDITNKEFADVYAQTIAYGMFAARLHDSTLQTFSRQEAAELIPKSNPFLRKLFQYIAGIDLDDRIRWIVDALADIFRATDVKGILQGFGKSTRQHDPMIHFYETFLAEYDLSLRKSRGVWYTPEPVVDFIVRSVDDILKKEFKLSQGLADSSKTTIKLDGQVRDNRTVSGYKQYEKEVHKVQILDPATGTGTFLAQTFKQIYNQAFDGIQGAWSSYVEQDLIPRIHGFEILMASYAVAHLKLELLLDETGYNPSKQKRLNIFLTNSLEEPHPDTGTLFANWLSKEASEANHVKRDTPVMVVMGNPPYSGESRNKGDWIMELMRDYKKEPGGKKKLQERNPKWINDDYVKFLRYSQHYVEKNGEGIVAFINPHGFLDNPTFRGVRWNLLKTYDYIYTIDLHGNAKKNETSSDKVDENVFDIEQGVSINIFIKTGEKNRNQLGKIFHYSKYGKRQEKYDFLSNNSFYDIAYAEIPCIEPMYYMVPKDFTLQDEYQKGFSIQDLFIESNVGVVTSRDKLVVDIDSNALSERIKLLFESPSEIAKGTLKVKENKSWNIEQVKRTTNFDNDKIRSICYRPFDSRFIYYDPAFIERSRLDIMQHMMNQDNLALNLCRQVKAFDINQHIFISDKISESCFISNKTSEIGSVFPLYLQKSKDGKSWREPNFKVEIIQAFEQCLDMPFEFEKLDDKTNVFTPIDVLDYIYSVLFSPAYREKYKEFLKLDFPCVPYPRKDTFWNLAMLGSELRKIHLLESPLLDNSDICYPITGDNVISRQLTKTSPGYVPKDELMGKVWINDSQYFDNVPLVAWDFFIGGYQPAQKWLKDRRGRGLMTDEIRHYIKIINALILSDSIMKKIDLLF